MRTMNIKEARASLSALVGRAERGEATVITRHGKQSAHLGPVPLPAKRLPDLSGFRSGMVATGDGLAATVIAARRKERC